MVNLLTYLNLIKEFFGQHLQVHSIKVGDKSNLTSMSDIIYPVVNIEYLDKTIRDEQDAYRFEIIIADISNDDIELSIINDCNQIADDFVNYFENVDRFDDLELVTNVSIIPFSDQFGDRVSGVTFTTTMTGIRTACNNTIPATIIADEGGFNYVFNFPL